MSSKSMKEIIKETVSDVKSMGLLYGLSQEEMEYFLYAQALTVGFKAAVYGMPTRMAKRRYMEMEAYINTLCLDKMADMSQEQITAIHERLRDVANNTRKMLS